MNEVHVRDTIADRELETWLVVDASASLDFGTVRMGKARPRVTRPRLSGSLGARSGNRIGGLIFDADGVTIVHPAACGTQSGDAAAPAAREPAACRRRPGVSSLQKRWQRPAVRPAAAAASSSSPTCIDSGSWPCCCAPRRAPRRDRRSGVGPARMVAARRRPADAGRPRNRAPNRGPDNDRKLRARFDAAATAKRACHRPGGPRAGARHLSLSTDRDWMVDLVAFAGPSRWAV